ncbi:MAG TPA: transcriptional repressor [Rhodospirillaceae bacterium]|nr:transcriptional repressor [Rhodospirillaceae bacterium]
MNHISKKKPEKDRLPTLLMEKGVRPTRQRLVLASYLFNGCHKHVTAEQVMAAVKKRKQTGVSLATVYNSLHTFTEAGLLREIPVGQTCSFFDTNTSGHHHFFDEVSGQLCDIPADALRVSGVLTPPAGRKIGSMDVTVRLVKASSRS